MYKKVHFYIIPIRAKFAGIWLSFNRFFSFLYRKMLRSNENSEKAKICVTNVMCDYCSWISDSLQLARIRAKERIRKKKKKMLRVDPVVIVHGGAGRIPQYARKFMLDEVKLFVIHIKQCDCGKPILQSTRNVTV